MPLPLPLPVPCSCLSFCLSSRRDLPLLLSLPVLPPKEAVISTEGGALCRRSRERPPPLPVLTILPNQPQRLPFSRTSPNDYHSSEPAPTKRVPHPSRTCDGWECIPFPQPALAVVLAVVRSPSPTPQRCHPERSLSRTMREAQSKDLRLSLPCLFLPFAFAFAFACLFCLSSPKGICCCCCLCRCPWELSVGLQPHEKSHAEGVTALPKAGVQPEGRNDPILPLPVPPPPTESSLETFSQMN